MKSKPFLSILIPVYNVENYIRQCLDSILSCSFYDYEIIIIIGTSTDNSNSICKEYKEKYQEKIPDIIIIYQTAKGYPMHVIVGYPLPVVNISCL